VIGTATGANIKFALGWATDELFDYTTQNVEESITDADPVNDAVLV